MRRIVKTRPSPFEMGIRNDNKYRGRSGVTGRKQVVSYFLPEAMSIFNSDMRLASINIKHPSYLGTDEIDYISGAPDTWNPCFHRKTEAVQLPYYVVFRGYSSTEYYYWNSFIKDPFTGSPVSLLDSHLWNDFTNAKARAWWSMQPRFEGQIDMLNFLWELNDLKHLLNAFRNAIEALFRFKRSFKKSTGGNPLNYASNSVLTYNLGIQPLLSDCSHIWSQIGEKVKEAQLQFQLDGQEPNTRYYSEVLADQSSYNLGAYNDYYHAYGTMYTTVFTACMRYGYEYKLRSDTEAFQKYWGLLGSWETIWNSTPFTFILDYFWKIGKAIHSMETDKNVKLELFKWSESIKTTRSSGVHLLRNSKGLGTTIINGVLEAQGLTSGYKSTLYSRTPTSPYKGLYVPIVPKRTTDKQRLNLLCLATSLFH